MMNLRFLISVIIFFPVNLSFAQLPPVQTPPPNIKAIVLSPGKANQYTPLIRLGDSFSLSFDDLDGDQKRYSYRIDHCDYNWKKSGLSPSEYLNGFAEDRFRDYENSFNTLQNYTHYTLRIPNENMRIKLTGNYLISVLDEDGEVLFSRRFIVYQPRVQVEVSVHRSRDINFIDQKQDVEFVINAPNLPIRNPREEIRVMVLQNFDWNTAMMNIPPKYISGGKLLYNYVSDISFWAGNEYLYFETKEIRNATNNIAKTRLDDIFNTYLFTDVERYNKAYSFNPDINGNFVLRTIDTRDIDLEGDYSRVHFSLEALQNPENQEIYIYGAYNDWELNDENKMTYNEQSRLYEASILFKQGFYNYTYVTLNPDGTVNNHEIEGSYFQTENEYTVIVYFKQFGDRYTQVIGVGSANSKSLDN